MKTDVEVLGPEDEPAIVDALCDAFAGYPVMRFVLGSAAENDVRLQTLIGLFVHRRVRLGGPLYGIRVEDGTLAGVATMTAPVESDAPEDLLRRRDRTFEVLGPDCRVRYEAYANAAKLFGDVGPHHHLNMLGVRRAHQGLGLARPLLQLAIARADADPRSSGVSLTTETEANVQLYEHFGFQVVGTARVSGEFQTWGLFRSASHNLSA